MVTQQIFFCSQCGELEVSETRIEKRSQTFDVRGEAICVESQVRVCAECGEVLSDSALDSTTMLAIYDLYRQRHNLLQPLQIAALRKNLGLSQKNLALLLGLGEVTVHRYESGALADAAQNNLLVLMQEPRNVRTLLERNDSLSSSAKSRLHKRLEELAPTANSHVGRRRPLAKRSKTSRSKVATSTP